METRFAVLVSNMERLTRSVEAMTEELRLTNSRVTTQDTEFRLSQQKLDRVFGELFTHDGASRTRVLELQIRGLFAMVSLLVMSIAGRFLPLVWDTLTGK